MNKRAVVTGVGVIAPNGIGTEDFWKGLVSGKSAIRKITRFDASSYPCQIAGEVGQFDPVDFMSPKIARKSTRYAQFAVAAARLALRDSGLHPERSDNHRMGIYMGNSLGGLELLEEQFMVFHEKGIRRLNPFTAMVAYPQSAASQLAIEFNVRGPTLTLSTGCPAAVNAVDVAIQEIQRGTIDVALVGGTEAPITPFSFAEFCASRTLANHYHQPEAACRPFDRNRSGWVMSEGAAVLVLEELGHAASRSVNIYGEVLGCSSMNDAHSLHGIDPLGNGLYRSMKDALSKARLSPQEIEYVSAHAPSMSVTDKVETEIIKKVFGEYAYRIPISSIKSMIGQPLAATAAFQLVACLLGFRDQTIPPTINHEYPDPECDLDCVPNKARKRTVDTALINTHGFGGLNATLIVRGTH